MVRKVVLFTVAMVVVAGCGRETSTTQAAAPSFPRPPGEVVEALARDPARLKEVRRLCREERAKVSQELCIASALAARQRFMGPHMVPGPVVRRRQE